MFSILIWLIFALIVGTVAKFLHPGKDPIGFFTTIGIGIAGSFIGGFIHSILSGGFQLFAPAGLGWSIVGGVVFCFLYSKYKSVV